MYFKSQPLQRKAGKMRVSQGYWGTRERGQFQPGNRGTKTKYLWKQGNKKRFREHGNKMLRKGGQKKRVM